MFAASKTNNAAPAVAVNYIEDVFSTWLYTGTGATQTITNGIDLSGKGGLVWIKGRSGATAHALYDTARGATFDLVSNTTAAQTTQATGLTAFGSTGFSIGALAKLNTSAATYASWTLRKQAKFFDIQTVTTNGSGTATFSHNLGSTPGCIIFKSTASAEAWYVWHRSVGNNDYLMLDSTSATNISTNWCVPSSTSISISGFTANQAQIVYIFAHDAGGFGLTGTDNVISCGSFTTNGSGNATVSLGYEPQWITIKASSTTSNWTTIDNMRGFTATTGSSNNSARLFPNLTNAEGVNDTASPNATGFTTIGLTGSITYIYIAIRRGPMKVPTDATKVFIPVAQTSAISPATITTNFPVDLLINLFRTVASDRYVTDRLRINSATNYRVLFTQSTAAELTGTGLGIGMDSNVSILDNGYTAGNADPLIYYNFRRAPSFFDIVCYTGTGSNTTITHNLAAVPQLMLIKSRSDASSWRTYDATNGATKYMRLNGTDASTVGSTTWNNTAPTSSVFTIGTDGNLNSSGSTYVAYLFATCAGVSKVGSYTGNGTTQTIDCGLTAGARFVLLKRTDSTGDWYVYDTARGMTTLTDPYLLLNTTAAEVATLGSVTTVSTGFALNSAILAAINVNAGTYIFLAIA
jgi:hypothetical protein